MIVVWKYVCEEEIIYIAYACYSSNYRVQMNCLFALLISAVAVPESRRRRSSAERRLARYLWFAVA